jgi:hypothetical protein
MSEREVGPMTLTEFLLARIAEDEAAAREPRWLAFEHGVDSYGQEVFAKRVLAECESKRRIVRVHGPRDGECDVCNRGWWDEDDDGTERYASMPEAYPCLTLRALALPYADHPDYRDEWKP